MKKKTRIKGGIVVYSFGSAVVVLKPGEGFINRDV